MRSVAAIAQSVKSRYPHAAVQLGTDSILVTQLGRPTSSAWQETYDELLRDFHKDSDIRTVEGAFCVDQGKDVPDSIGFVFTFYRT